MDYKHRPPTPLNLFFRPLTISQDDHSSEDSLLYRCEQQGVAFYQLFMLREDLSLISQLCYENKTHSLAVEDDVEDAIITSPEWKSLRKGWRTQRGLKHYTGFIVESDEDSGIDEPVVQSRRECLAWYGESKAIAQQSRTTSNEALYQEVAGNPAQQEVNLVSVLEDIMDRLKNEALEDTVILQTL